MKLKNFETLFAAVNKLRDNHLDFDVQDFDIEIKIFGDRSYLIELEFAFVGATLLYIIPDEDLKPEEWLKCKWLSGERKQKFVNWIIENKEIF